MAGTATAVEAKVMRAIVAREHRAAMAERRTAREAHAASTRSPTSAPFVFDPAPEANRMARTCSPGQHERQRIQHLVLAQPRPPAKSVGKGRNKRKIPARLEPGIEHAVQLRESWSHKQGTPETLERAARTQQGSLARLYRSGVIDGQQLDCAAAIATIAARIAADVNVRTASLETRVDVTRSGDGTFFERLGQVRAEMAYTRWRAALGGNARLLLDLIIEDVGLAEAARRHRVHARRVRRLLVSALDLWAEVAGVVAREVGREELNRAHAVLLG